MASLLVLLPPCRIVVNIAQQHVAEFLTDSSVSCYSRKVIGLPIAVYNSELVQDLRLFMDNSAKVVEDNEITPQSKYVIVQHNGTCEWHPRYELSATHCLIDAHWFPFDEQVCNVTFESWLLPNKSMKLFLKENTSITTDNFSPPEGWDLKGTLC